MPVKVAKSIIKQLFEILRYLHSEDVSVCHRDLNPNNVMVTQLDPADHNSEVVVKLIDFNVSRKFRGRNFLTKPEDSPAVRRLLMLSQTGAPAFSAPEILTGGSYTESIDMWGAGCLFYMCLFGTSPFPQTE